MQKNTVELAVELTIALLETNARIANGSSYQDGLSSDDADSALRKFHKTILELENSTKQKY